MSEYMNGTYKASDKTLVRYKGDDIVLNIPEKLGDVPICNIGKSAFMKASKLQQVVVPRSVTKIEANSFQNCQDLMTVFLPGTVESVGKCAFSICPKLFSINFYDLEVSRFQYDSFKSDSIKFGNRYLTKVFPKIKCVTEAVLSSNTIPANMVQHGISKLFTSQDLEEDKGRVSLTRNISCFDSQADLSYCIEEDAFLTLISSNRDTPFDRISEQKNDEFSRMEKFPSIEKTAVFSFDDEKTKEKNGRISLFANVNIGYHFWQSKVPVLYKNKQYYIYRRNYLSFEPNLNYIRKDVAVFKDNMIVTDKKEAQQAFAKYRLLSIL